MRLEGGTFLSAGRGVVLAGVLVVVVVLALLAGTALVIADAEAMAARGVLRREQSRSTAWSGVQAVMAELARQRSEIAAGGAPELTASWALSGEGTGPREMVRLLELQPGRVVVPEAGKLDLNSVDASVLTASGALSIAEAEAVVEARGAAPFGSVGEALAATPEKTEITTAFEGELAGRTAERLAGKLNPEDRLTVFAFEPNVQEGIGGGEAGAERIFVGEGWSEELKPLLQARLGGKAAAAVEKTLRAGAPKKMGDVIAGLRREQVEVREWASVLDALTVTEDAYVAGRVDIHTAPREVLRALPGMTDALAEQVERTRDRIDPEARRSVVWLVRQGVLTGAQFQGIVDSITSRCLQWRVRVEGGSAGLGEEARTPARDRVVLEAVIDLSGERPRLAYLRDVTHLESVELVESLRAESAAGDDRAERPLERAADLELESGMEEIEVDPGAGLELDAGLDLGAGLGAEAGGDLELSPLDLGGPGAGGRGRDEREGSGKGAGSGVDRRVGRWKIPSKPAAGR